MNIISETPTLSSFPRPLKFFILGFLFVLSSGVSLGLIYLFTETTWTPTGTVEHYRGSTDKADDFAVKEKYEKPLTEMLLTTHNHLIGFSFIFFFVCLLFYFNTTITGTLKSFLMAEPFVSTWMTFFSLWGIRYLSEYFVYLTFFSALLTYVSFYFITMILVYELTGLRKNNQITGAT